MTPFPRLGFVCASLTAVKANAGAVAARSGRETKWTLEHVKALCNSGKNAESNLGVTCSWCLPEKNAEDVAEKSETYRVRAKHVGVDLKPKYKWPKRPMNWRGRKVDCSRKNLGDV